MKKNLLALTAAIVAMVFVSCGSIADSISGSIKMDTPQAAEKVVESLKKNINFDEWKIYSLRWVEGEKLENDLLLLSVSMVNKSNDCFNQTFLLGGTLSGNVGDLDKDRTAKGIDFESLEGITPEMIKPELIQKQYDEAKAGIPAQYEFRSIESYELSIALPSGNSYIDGKKKFGYLEGNFTINAIEVGKEYVQSAGKKTLQYYEFDFNVLPDGSIEFDD